MSLQSFLLSQLTHYTTQLWTFHETPHTNTLPHKGLHSGLMVCWVCEEKVRGGPDQCVCVCALVALTHSLEQMCCCCSGGCHFLLLACEHGQLLSKGPTSAWSLTSAPPQPPAPTGAGPGAARWGVAVCAGGVYEFRVLAVAFWGETCGVCVCLWGIRAGGWVLEGGYRRNTWLRKTLAERGVQSVRRHRFSQEVIFY